MDLFDISDGDALLAMVFVIQAIILFILIIFSWQLLKLKLAEEEVRRLQNEKWLFLTVNGTLKGKDITQEFKDIAPISNLCEKPSHALPAEATTSEAHTQATAKKSSSGVRTAEEK